MSGQNAHQMIRAVGRSENQQGEGVLWVEMGFYADIPWETRCNIEVNV